MSTNDLQKLKPVYIHETDRTIDNDISLIDLAMVLNRRKTMITLIFTVTLALGVAMSFFTPKSYTFSSSIEIGSQIIDGSIQAFESPQALLAKLQYSFIPQNIAEYKQSNPGDTNKYQINASVPAGSNITLLEIKGTKEQTKTLKNLLQAISQKAINDHSRIYNSVKSDLENRLNQVSNTSSLVTNMSDDGRTAKNRNTIETLTTQLANLLNTREILPPIRSLDPTGTSTKTIIITFTFAGIFLGIFTALFIEFISKVKQKTEEEEAKNS